MKTSKATFGAGCFWHVEEEFRKIGGVTDTKVGYTGGDMKNPTYEDVSTHRTGHAEAVQVEFDPNIVSYDKLLKVFWSIHDPTQLNRQGLDIGSNYRSVIFYDDERQRKAALTSRDEAQKDHGQKIVTEIVPAKEFYRAEEYHQQYLKKKSHNAC